MPRACSRKPQKLTFPFEKFSRSMRSSFLQDFQKTIIWLPSPSKRISGTEIAKSKRIYGKKIRWDLLRIVIESIWDWGRSSLPFWTQERQVVHLKWTRRAGRSLTQANNILELGRSLFLTLSKRIRPVQSLPFLTSELKSNQNDFER